MDVGHILVHYLFTNTYQCLRPKGSTACEMQAAEFTNCVHAYSVAQTYNLPFLAERAETEMKRIGEVLPMFTVLTALLKAYPNPSTDDAFLSGYMKSRMKILFADLTAMRAISLTEAGSHTRSIAELLFTTMITLRLEEVKEEHNTNGM